MASKVTNPITAQEQAVEAILAAPYYKNSLGRLHRLGRTIGAIHNQLDRELVGCGYSPAELSQAWQDVVDMAELELLSND